MTWLLPLLTCLGLAAAFGAGFFHLGRVYEREQPQAQVIHLPARRCAAPRSHVRTFGGDGAA